MIEYRSGVSVYRVWWDELPDWTYDEGETIRLEVEAHTSPILEGAETRQRALEIRTMRGAREVYGGLGATFSPQKTGTLHVEMVMSRDQGQRLIDGAASRSGMVYKGLPYREYVIALCGGILSSPFTNQLGAGKIRMAWATHSLESSSPWLFQVLGGSIMGLLA